MFSSVRASVVIIGLLWCGIAACTGEETAGNTPEGSVGLGLTISSASRIVSSGPTDEKFTTSPSPVDVPTVSVPPPTGAVIALPPNSESPSLESNVDQGEVGSVSNTLPSTTIGSPTPSRIPTPTEVKVGCDVVPQADCRGATLARAELQYANLQGSDFSGADLSGADLTGADLSDADFSGANLTGAILDFATLFGTDLSGARLVRASFNAVVWDDLTLFPVGFVPPY